MKLVVGIGPTGTKVAAKRDPALRPDSGFLVIVKDAAGDGRPKYLRSQTHNLWMT